MRLADEINRDIGNELCLGRIIDERSEYIGITQSVFSPAARPRTVRRG
jgi:hypothetical protein